MAIGGTRRARLGNAIELLQGAVSPLAGAGVAAAVGSQYYGPDGITWRRMGSTATSWAQQLMRGPYLNVKDFGAVGDGVTDDRAAIQAAITAGVALGGAVIFFPVGKFMAYTAGAASETIFSLSGTASGKLLFMGTGRASEIVMAGNGNSNDRFLFHIAAGAKHVGFKNLELYSELTNPAEQNHLIQFSNTSGVELETGRGFVTDCYFGHVRGDAIRTLGNNTQRVSYVTVKRNVFEMANVPASRSCVSIQRASDNILVDMNWMEGTSPIDSEPTGIGSVEKLRITRNFCPTANIAIPGNGAGEEQIDSVIIGNTLTDGCIIGGDIGRNVIAENIIDFSPLTVGQNEGNIDLFERITQIIVADNIIFRGGLSDPSIPVVQIQQQGPIGLNEGAIVVGNLITDDRDSIDNGCIALRGDMNRSITQRNLLLLKISAVNNGVCAIVEGQTAPSEDSAICENMGIGTNAVLAQCFQIFEGNAVMSDNFCRNASRGVRFTNTTAQRLAARNNMVAIINEPIGLTAGVNSVPVEGVGSGLGVGVLQIIVAPEGLVSAPVGTIGLRSTGGGAGSTLYVKEGGGVGNTGWDAK